MPTRNNDKLLPHLSFSILFALSARPTHGYELMQRIREDSDGSVTMGPGALYTTLKQLSQDGLIEAIPFESFDNRRKYYSLTRKGLERLRSDLAYMQRITMLAQDRTSYQL